MNREFSSTTVVPIRKQRPLACFPLVRLSEGWPVCGGIAQLVERLLSVQKVWRSTRHTSKQLFALSFQMTSGDMQHCLFVTLTLPACSPCLLVTLTLHVYSSIRFVPRTESTSPPKWTVPRKKRGRLFKQATLGTSSLWKSSIDSWKKVVAFPCFLENTSERSRGSIRLTRR